MSIYLLVSFLLLHLCFSSLSFFSFSCSIVSHSSGLYFSITLSFLTYIVLCLLCFHTLFFRSFISTSFSFIICFVLISVPQFQCFLLLPFFWSPIVCFVSKLCSLDPPFISTFFFFLFHHLFYSYLFHSHISLPQFQCFLLLSLSWSPILTFIISPFLLSYQHPFCLSHSACIMSSFLS